MSLPGKTVFHEAMREMKEILKMGKTEMCCDKNVQHSICEGLRAQKGTVTVQRQMKMMLLVVIMKLMMMQEERGR